ncbi:MAG: hypothetical protein GWN99_08985 [Gemmatimonadetes bacterium]|uniref:TrkH family potassium uptake protein n=1 Tax=Candidatus Kutchimonas denitrificans TaxID=3056748 RepID=A0AAE4ZB01_9BACT|nr:hypothetical protein [Gemmatimonadota bacterium]NIR76699.1 hypothetical protein [Candidatus Kutchimonas denitrificans]NIS01186.1 hypothetical protein [Gemmatimonadota bacterium]NIT68225.1 hypothetical protein [Gemmatimonadota bacterium]NIW75443.1 hypothetical protein [Gemmatimonadota bacterium]
MRQARELIYAVRLRVVGRYVGELAGVIAALTIVPLIVSLVSGEPGTALRYVVVIVITASLAAALFRLPKADDIQTNEALVVVACVFMLAAAAMIYPLMAGGLSFLDALFEAVSGVTTTGLTATATVEDKTAAFLFARAWMQWYGGLGFVDADTGKLFAEARIPFFVVAGLETR